MNNEFFGFIILLTALGLVLYIGKAIKSGTIELRKGEFVIATYERRKNPYKFWANVALWSLVVLIAAVGGVLAFFT